MLKIRLSGLDKNKIAKRRLSKQSQKLLRRCLRKFAPPEKLKVSEWAEKYRMLSAESSSEHGKWKNHRAPHLVEVMDVVDDPRVEEVFVMFPSQMGKSEGINNIFGRNSHLRPGPMLMLQPSVQMAEDYSKDRIVPMVRDTKVLLDLVGDSGSRTNTTLHKTFPGGHLTLVGSNSPSSLASRPIRDLLVDELDRCAITSEGDSVLLAEKRTTNFYDRTIFKVSTPTHKNTSRIERGFNRSDKRRRFVTCLKCDHAQTLIWSNVKWEKKIVNGERKHLTDTAYYECEKCQHKIYDGERYRLLDKAFWKATAEFNGAVGFHINELYSKWRKLSQIVKVFLKSKDDPEKLKIFVNTVLALPFEYIGETPDWNRLYERRENYPIGTIPKGGVFLTCGIDVQGDRIHGEVVAWGRNFETWSVENFILHGDPKKPGSKVWKQLDKQIAKTYENSKGIRVGISKVCIDANWQTSTVHKWARKYPFSRVRCIFGDDKQRMIVGAPRRVDLKKDKKYGLKSYPVGVSVIKEELYAFLNQNAPTEDGEGYPFGYCHFPEYDAEFFKELCAETQRRRKNKRGYTRYEWVVTRDRNEALDTRVYARAAAFLEGIDRFSEQDWIDLENDYAGGISRKQEVEDDSPIKKKESSFWS